MSSSVGSPLALLQSERPRFHGSGDDPVNWQLGDDMLRWLDTNTPERGSTLETGCGYSTVVLSTHSARHVVVSPVVVEHERILEWCAAHDVPMSGVRFISEPSQYALTDLVRSSEPLFDLVLIDGAHSFPMPSVDWMWGAALLKVGGLMVLDDIQIRAVGVLKEFLDAETRRWTHVATPGSAVVYRKLADTSVSDIWRDQPWNRASSGLGATRVRATARRAVVGLRRRIKTAIGR